MQRIEAAIAAIDDIGAGALHLLAQGERDGRPVPSSPCRDCRSRGRRPGRSDIEMRLSLAADEMHGAHQAGVVRAHDVADVDRVGRVGNRQADDACSQWPWRPALSRGEAFQAVGVTIW
jgi:hypothetical protein